MGLRTEQMNTQDMLKYFVARNEFNREALIKLISDLRITELQDINLFNQKDVVDLFDTIKEQILWLINREDYRTVRINDNNLDPNAFYYEDFITTKPFKIILDKRTISYNPYASYLELFDLIKQSNPENGVIIREENDLNSIDDLKADYIYESSDVILRTCLTQLLNNRQFGYSSVSSTADLIKLVQYTNPMYLVNTATDNTYVEKDLVYENTFLEKFGYKVLLSARSVTYNDLTTLEQLKNLASSSNPNNFEETDTEPIKANNKYTENFLSKYGYLLLLQKRNITGYDYSSNINDLILAVNNSNPISNSNFMTLEELTDAINADKNFYIKVNNNTQNISQLIKDLANLEKNLTANTKTSVDNAKKELTSYIDKQDTDIINNYKELVKNTKNELSTNHDNDINSLNTNLKKYADDLNNTTNKNVTINKNDITKINNEFSIYKTNNNTRLEYVEYLLDSMLTTTASGKFTVRRGKNRFLGNSSPKIIKHGIGKKPVAVFLHTEENSNGKLGEVWMTYDEDNIIVYNSGTANTNFYFVAFVSNDDNTDEYIKSGTANFAGNNKAVTIPHDLGKIPDLVDFMPCEKPNGNLGEYYFTVDATNIYVYNTGTFTGKFNWTAMKKDTFLNGDESDTVVSGVSSFLGNSNTVTIPHGLGKKPFFFTAHPIQKTGALVGEIYLNSDEKNIYILNTGSGKSNFKYMIYDTNLQEINNVYLRYADSTSSNIDGYFDRDENENPKGTTVINYAGRFRSTKFDGVGGGCIATALPVDNISKFPEGCAVFAYSKDGNVTYASDANPPSSIPSGTIITFVGICTYNYSFLNGSLVGNKTVPVCLSGLVEYIPQSTSLTVNLGLNTSIGGGNFTTTVDKYVRIRVVGYTSSGNVKKYKVIL